MDIETNYYLTLKRKDEKSFQIMGGNKRLSSKVDKNSQPVELSKKEIKELKDKIGGIENLQILSNFSNNEGFHQEYSRSRFDTSSLKTIKTRCVVQQHAYKVQEDAYLNFAEGQIQDANSVILRLFIRDLNRKSKSSATSDDAAEVI